MVAGVGTPCARQWFASASLSEVRMMASSRRGQDPATVLAQAFHPLARMPASSGAMTTLQSQRVASCSHGLQRTRTGVIRERDDVNALESGEIRGQRSRACAALLERASDRANPARGRFPGPSGARKRRRRMVSTSLIAIPGAYSSHEPSRLLASLSACSSLLAPAESRLCDGLSRREVLRVGGLSALGLSLPDLLQARERRRPRPARRRVASSCS